MLDSDEHLMKSEFPVTKYIGSIGSIPVLLGLGLGHCA